MMRLTGQSWNKMIGFRNDGFLTSYGLRGSVRTPVAAAKRRRKFDPQIFLSTIDSGRKITDFPKRRTIFSQGDSCDAVFCIQKGKVKLTVLSKSGQEATIGILSESAFFGEGCLTGQALRMCSATAMTDCTVMRIDLTKGCEGTQRHSIAAAYQCNA
jgi:hypothetical protein